MNKERIYKLEIIYENRESVIIPLDNILDFDITVNEKNILVNDFHLSVYTYNANDVNIYLKGLSARFKKQLYSDYSITAIYVGFENKEGLYINVPNPTYFLCWLPNPYIVFSEIDDSDFLTIRIYKHLSWKLIKLFVQDKFYLVRHHLDFYKYRIKYFFERFFDK